MMSRILYPVAAAVVLLVAGCGSESGESAHRAAAAEALGRDRLTDNSWSDVQRSAQETCDEDDGVFALATTMSAGDEQAIALRRVNVEHVCPERLEELDRLIAESSG